MTVVDSPSVTGLDERLLGSGGGGGWDGGDDEFGDAWGWSDEPYDEDEEPYERPRIVRVLAIVLALFVITGTVGAYVAVVTVGSNAQFEVSDLVMTVPRGPAGSSSVIVRFVLANEASRPARARCTASVDAAQGAAGVASAVTSSLPADARTSHTLRVPITGPFAGHAAVEVTCIPVRNRPS